MSRVLFPLRFCADPGTEGKGQKRRSKIHQDRDAWVLGELTRLFYRPGDQVEALFNVPGDQLGETAARSLMFSGDLVLVATRLPGNEKCPEGDDDQYYARKPVIRGDNWLEHRILDGCGRFLAWWNRKYVLLTREGASCLADDYQRRACAHFHVTDDATYERLGVAPAGDQRQSAHPSFIDWRHWKGGRSGASTAGYIIYVKELWAGGPSCLSIFSMSGPTTFGFVSAVTEIWSQALPGGVDFDESELIFVEISAGRRDVPLTPSNADGYPTYWRQWQFAWNRGGTLTDWPRQCPPRARRIGRCSS